MKMKVFAELPWKLLSFTLRNAFLIKKNVYGVALTASYKFDKERDSMKRGILDFITLLLGSKQVFRHIGTS